MRDRDDVEESDRDDAREERLQARYEYQKNEGRGPRTRRTPTYGSWRHMLARTRDVNDIKYPEYGGRGIRVCERWMTFENFLTDMGTRPTGTTLDRIDGDGHYEPGNVRWATPAQQSQNTKQTVLNWDTVDEIRGRYEHGEHQASIARRLNVSKQLISIVCRQVGWKDSER